MEIEELEEREVTIVEGKSPKRAVIDSVLPDPQL